MSEKEDAIIALQSTYEALRAEAVKSNEGPNGPLRIQCNKILCQINKLSSPVSFDVVIKTPDLPKTAEAWQLWKVILACTVAAPVALVMLALLYATSNISNPNSKFRVEQDNSNSELRVKEYNYEQEKELWEKTYAACKIKNWQRQQQINLVGGGDFCKDKLVANGMKYPY